MRIILHIGAWKTGSTAVQNFLSENVDALADRGVKIPPIAMTSLGRAKMRHRLGSADSGLAGQTIDEIRSLDTPGGGSVTVVLSCEHFWQMPETEVARMRTALATVSDDISVVLYVRPQYDMWRTLYAQQAKSLQVAPDAAKWGTADFVSQRHLDHALFYHRCLAKYANAFGQMNVAARLYDRQAFQDGDVALDFLAYLGVAAEGLKRSADLGNASLGWKGVAFSIWMVGALSLGQESAAGREPWRRAYRRTVKQMATETGDGAWLGNAVDVLSTEDKIDIHQHYSEDNDRLFADYFGGHGVFEPPGAGSGDTVDHRDIAAGEFRRACDLLRRKGQSCGLSEQALARVPSMNVTADRPSVLQSILRRRPFSRHTR